MAQIVKETRTLESADTNETNTTTEPDSWTAARIVYLITGLLMAVLAMRFLLSLLGANRDNAFASIIYNLSYPFVAPFFGLFNYRVQYGVSRFEVETLVAMAVYAFIAWFIVRLITVKSPPTA